MGKVAEYQRQLLSVGARREKRDGTGEARLVGFRMKYLNLVPLMTKSVKFLIGNNIRSLDHSLLMGKM